MRKLYTVLFTNVLLVFASAQTNAPCVDGMASFYPCQNIDLLNLVQLGEMGGGSICNDLWGWTDPLDNKEYALVGKSNGTAFIDVTDPMSVVYLGDLPSHDGVESTWRDIKVFNNHAFVVSEAGGHGMQVFDLSRLRDVSNPPETFTEDAHYDGFGNAHNVVINETTGYAYGVGSGTYSGGPHFVNINDPLNPLGEGGYEGDGYTHDAQVVIYNGPDFEYAGKELYFGCNANSLTIVDVTDKSDPQLVSRSTYANSQYAHQGWLTEDQKYFFMDDELDEINLGNNTRTFIWDVQNVDEPFLLGDFFSTSTAIDHNMYVKDNKLFQSNYTAGLRILDITDVANANLSELAFFDVYPLNDDPVFSGTWSNYPYFESGNVIVSSMSFGLFIVKPNLSVGIDQIKNKDLQIFPVPTGEVLNIRYSGNEGISQLKINDVYGRTILAVSYNTFLSDLALDVSDLSAGIYFLTINGHIESAVKFIVE